MNAHATSGAEPWDYVTSIDPDGYDGGGTLDPWGGSLILEPWEDFIDPSRRFVDD